MDGLEGSARDRMHFLLLNLGHYLDHLFTLIFATVAALALSREWGLGYGELIKYATPGFLAFGLFSLPAGWLADKWNREGMMVVFFIGSGLASIATSFATTPAQVGTGLFVIGVFAAIYHPVGLAIVTENWRNTGSRIAMNGVWGNLGVASAALITGYFIDNGGWRSAFVAPGVASIMIGLAYAWLMRDRLLAVRPGPKSAGASGGSLSADQKSMLKRISAIVFATAAFGSIIFQSTTFALPKIFDEKLQGVAANLAVWGRSLGASAGFDTATAIGSLAFIVFAVASIAQLIVGRLLDRHGARPVFMGIAVIQFVFFAAMPSLAGGYALAAALGFMVGSFGQIPINDFMIGKMATGEYRARIYGIRYVVSFTVLAATLPLIGFVHQNWGFDALFRILAGASVAIFAAVSLLPGALPNFTPQKAVG